MLRLPPFELLHPRTVAEAVLLLEQHGPRARIVSGGTDLLPNMKLGHARAEVLVSLSRVEELRGVRRDADRLLIGAATRLQEVADDAQIGDHIPVLAKAAGRVAGPQIRNLGTLGGNLCLDTRCRYINQSPLYRTTLGGCLKADADECRVVLGGRNCVAALAADTVPVLTALGAKLHLEGPIGARTCALEGFYHKDGTGHLNLGPGELLRDVEVPVPEAHVRLTYRKWSVRRSIDFPLVSVAIRLECRQGKLERGLVVVGALGPRPRTISLNSFEGETLKPGLAVAVAEAVHRTCRPLANVPYDPEYRRHRLRVEVRRALEELL